MLSHKPALNNLLVRTLGRSKAVLTPTSKWVPTWWTLELVAKRSLSSWIITRVNKFFSLGSPPTTTIWHYLKTWLISTLVRVLLWWVSLPYKAFLSLRLHLNNRILFSKRCSSKLWLNHRMSTKHQSIYLPICSTSCVRQSSLSKLSPQAAKLNVFAV